MGRIKEQGGKRREGGAAEREEEEGRERTFNGKSANIQGRRGGGKYKHIQEDKGDEKEENCGMVHTSKLH